MLMINHAKDYEEIVTKKRDPFRQVPESVRMAKKFLEDRRNSALEKYGNPRAGIEEPIPSGGSRASMLSKGGSRASLGSTGEGEGTGNNPSSSPYRQPPQPTLF